MEGTNVTAEEAGRSCRIQPGGGPLGEKKETLLIKIILASNHAPPPFFPSGGPLRCATPDYTDPGF